MKYIKKLLGKEQEQSAFVLPTVLVLSVVLLTIGLSVFQLTSSIARSLTDQYWQRLAKQASQAGISYMSACVDQGLSSSTWPASITQDNTCLGASLTTPQPQIFTNSTDTNPVPNPFKSRFTIYRPTTGADGIAKAKVAGSVDILNSGGSTIKTYTYEMTAIINGPTKAYDQVTTGRKHTCGLSDGQVFCWGNNAATPFEPTRDNTMWNSYGIDANDNTVLGQLGIGTTDLYKSSPTAVVNTGVLSGKNVTQIAAGYNFTCALASGKVYCWGHNIRGQLGNGSYANSNVPVAVSTSGQLSGKSVVAIAAGADFACALASGKVYCWGQGTGGQHGNGTSTTTNVPDAVVSTITGVTSISAGSDHACAINSVGVAYCWGNNWGGQFGNNTTTGANTPQAVNTAGVLSGKSVTKIAANNGYTCAIATGKAYCWGYNIIGQLGDNSTTNRLVPVAVNTAGVLSGKSVTDISSSTAAEYHTCAIANGESYCWGGDWAGQLGDNNWSQTSVPVKTVVTGVLSGKALTSTSAGGAHTCVSADGQLYCWGKGSTGQLGNGKDYVTNGNADVYQNNPIRAMSYY